MNDLSNQTEDFSDIRDAVRSLCQGYPGEYWREKDRKREYPTEFVQALTDSGFLAVLIPEIFGGSELGIQEAAAILEEIHKSGCNGAACHAQMYIMGTLLRHGSEEQKQKYLPGIASGELRLQAFGVTEPGSGTDTTSIRTFAKREGDEYVVNGQKVWTSRAEHSDLMLLLARTTPKDEVTKRTDGLSVFLVDLRKSLNHGVTIRPISTMINHATTEVFIDDLRIPAEQRIGEEGKGFRYILDGMNAERILIGAECIGDPIAKAYAQSEAADLMVRKAASLFDSGKPCGKEANMAKLLAADASWEAADVCLQTHGGFGFAEEYDIERKFRETRLYRIAPVSTNLILSYLAEHVLGLPRSF
ncbi:MAG: acyl-CoA dehydrogenase [Proteobacteria bacterium]|nr:acyl-CoA dehydrogenase [Pseudomonadota bacterium]